MPWRRSSSSRPGARPSAWSALFAAAALAATPAAPAQQPAAPGPIVSFTSPDGSRFVLVQDPAVAGVHWAVATFADADDEPPGLEGLAMAVARASLSGTWLSGSSDAAAEQRALAAFDQALTDLYAASDRMAALQAVRAREAEVTRLGDDTAFLRVLAALPVHRPELHHDRPVCLLHLSTLPAAIVEVGQRLVERREQQALRNLPGAWLQEVTARQAAFDADPFATVCAELLALAMPNHPASRGAERAGRGAPRRDRAMAVWQATQRPERTVHVLLGNFDASIATTGLNGVFDKTALPAPAPAAVAPPRQIQSLRRSTVPGLREPTVAIAWLLPAVDDPHLVAAAAHWFAGGHDSHLGRQLAQAGRQCSVVRATAPWPAAVDGQSLLLVLVTDAKGTDQLADQVLAASRSATATAIAASTLQPATTALQQAWVRAMTEPRRRAGELARQALLWPRLPPCTPPPPTFDPAAVRALLTAVFRGQPVIVEGRR